MSQRAWIGIIAFVALVGGIIASLYIAPPGDITSTGDVPQYMQVYPQARQLDAFTLTQQNGQSFTDNDLRGHWTLAFLGYTFCPDICPTTLASLAKVYPDLKALPTSAPIQVVFISVDPKRDTPERLTEYMNFFHSEFIAASGPHANIFPLVRNLGMMYSIADSTDKPNYLVDHSASVVVINPSAQVIGRFKPELEPGKLAISDADQILADMPAVLDGSY